MIIFPQYVVKVKGDITFPLFKPKQITFPLFGCTLILILSTFSQQSGKITGEKNKQGLYEHLPVCF